MGDPPDLPPGTFNVPIVDGATSSAIPPSNKDDFSARDVTLFGVLGVLFGALLAGGFALYDSHSEWGSFLALVGAGGLLVMVILLVWYRLKIIHALIVTIAALVATWAVFAYVLWTKPKEVIVHDPPTTDAEKQRAERAAQQLATYQTQLPTLQSQLATSIKERDNLQRSLEETISQLNATRAQVGPKSPILGLDDAKKWQVFKAIKDTTTYNQGQPLECHAVASLTPDQNKLAFALYSEFVEILGRAWPGGNVQGFPTPPHQPFGIMLLVGGHSGNAFECASHLAGVLQNMLPIPITLRANQASDNLTTCNNECVEMRYGGEH